MDLFARSEVAVTETLLVLAAVDGKGTSIKLPHLVGQRYDALASAVGVGGVFENEGKAAAGALSTFRRHDALRTQLAHGIFTVTLDHRGRWHLVARVVALRAGRECRDVLATDQDETAETFAAIEADGARLRSTLGQLRRRLKIT